MFEQLRATLQYLTPIPDAELAKAEKIFRPKTLKKSQPFIRAGDTPTQLAFVASGLLRLYYISASGDEFTKSFCAENNFITAYSALLLGQPSRIFIDALEPTDMLVTDYADYQTLSVGHPCWQIVNRKFVEALYIRKELRESELLLDDATTRYQRFLQDYPGLDGRLKQYHIASYLGITPVSLSRIRAQLEKINTG